MSDNTKINEGVTGNTISTEEISSTEPRQGTGLPTETYHIPRSKIAVGGFGQDAGDVTAETPLPVESRSLRHLAEIQFVATLNNADAALRTRGTERANLVDRRGDTGERGYRR